MYIKSFHRDQMFVCQVDDDPATFNYHSRRTAGGVSPSTARKTESESSLFNNCVLAKQKEMF